jgi:hypothetical protein
VKTVDRFNRLAIAVKHLDRYRAQAGLQLLINDLETLGMAQTTPADR